jgi:c-di-AMP phosphodiesterase-like protein
MNTTQLIEKSKSKKIRPHYSESRRLTLRLRADNYKFLSNICKDKNISQSAFVEEIIQELKQKKRIL